MTKLKIQTDDLSNKNKSLMDESRNNLERIKILEEKNAATKIVVSTLKINLRDKENEANRLKESASTVESLKIENNTMLKKIDEQNKKMKNLQVELE